MSLIPPITMNHLHPWSLRGIIQENPWAHVRYVDSSHSQASDSGNDGYNPAKPYATLDQACTDADDGDVIVVGPGHAESIIAAGDVTISADNVTVMGVGRGASRPTLTVDTASTADLVVSGGGCRLINLNLVAGLDGVDDLLSISGADCHILGCRLSGDATYQYDYAISATSSVDLRVEACEFFSETPSAQAGISLTGATRPAIINCHFVGDWNLGCISAAVTPFTRALIVGNYMQNANASDTCISTPATSTGFVAYNAMRIATDAQTTWINSVGDFELFENYGVNVDGETGVLIGTPSA